MSMHLDRRLLPAVLAVVALAGCADPTPQTRPAPPQRADVLWDEWTAEAFVRAKAENRLVLVHVVAEWSHACHVMDRTTYTDARIAALLDADWVAIRVDAGAHPDVAERWGALELPATVILTPDALPLRELGGTQDADTLIATLSATAGEFRAGTAVPPTAVARTPPANADLASIRGVVAAQLDAAYDTSHAGWGRAPKTPLAAPVESEFLAEFLTGDAAHRGRALATLAQEAKLVDPVWGGMYRCSASDDWEHPQFEKLAAVQADAISSFAQAYFVTGDKAHLDAAKSVQRYVADFLTGEDGAFYAGQDADLGAHGPADEWIEGREYFALGDAERRAKGVPFIDTAVYADCNGLLIESLCDLYEASRDAATLNAARKAANRIVKSHAAPLGGFTHRDAAASGSRPMQYLSDQVAMGRAFLALAETTGDAAWTARADAVAQVLRDLFEDKSGGGFHAHTYDARAGGVFSERRKDLAGNARAARFLVRLHHVTGEELWLESAGRALRSFADGDATAAAGPAAADYLIALEEFARPPLRIDVVGKPGTKETNALQAAALAVHVPARIVRLTPPGDEYPDIGASAAYVRRGAACSPPVTDPAKVAAAGAAVLAVSN
jgi:uncharacterized protein YyaL (SSP411 family)